MIRDISNLHQATIEGLQKKNNPAGYMHQRMMEMIQAHQKRIPEDFELGLQVIGGSAPAFHLRSITYSNPDILIFIGKDTDGNLIQLMQHHSQMSVVLVAMPKLEEKAYRIGF
ncbi:hypothetical protein G6M86_04665 [Agrobacterium tumefaciens]|uniref:Uncharacterized protein n=1 Tax=Agrobacterium tumefaciens TaxID=358 RepID=A0AAJ4MZW2_AGRTU|nr:hypothetical protein G6M86_04665 [Agrobacterium tumefaciens]